jgi:hypothetical protein
MIVRHPFVKQRHRPIRERGVDALGWREGIGRKLKSAADESPVLSAHNCGPEWRGDSERPEGGRNNFDARAIRGPAVDERPVRVAQVVVAGATAIRAAQQRDPVRFHKLEVAFGVRVLVAADRDRRVGSPEIQDFVIGTRAGKEVEFLRNVQVGIVRRRHKDFVEPKELCTSKHFLK